MWHRFPAILPHIFAELFDLFGAVVWHLEEWICLDFFVIKMVVFDPLHRHALVLILMET